MVHAIDREKAVAALAKCRNMLQVSPLDDEYDDLFDEWFLSFKDACDEYAYMPRVLTFIEVVLTYNPEATDEYIFSLVTDILGIEVR